MSIELVIPSHHLILCCPLLLFNFSQHQGLFQWVASLHQAVKVLKLNTFQHQSFQWIFRTNFLLGCLVWSPCCLSFSRAFSSATVEGISSLALNLLYGPTLTSVHDYWKTIALTRWIFVGKIMSLLFNKLSRFVIDLFKESSIF